MAAFLLLFRKILRTELKLSWSKLYYLSKNLSTELRTTVNTILLSLIAVLTGFSTQAQTVISGTVTDSESGETIPFVNIYIKGTTAGATSGISGNYRISTTQVGDTLIASYIGFIPQKVAIKPGQTQTIDFALQSELVDLQELVFGREFASGVLPFQLFTAITVHRVAEYGMLLRAAGRTRELLVVASVTLGSNVVLAGFGAWAGGMSGSAWGTLIASAIGWLTALRYIGVALDVPVRLAFPWVRWLSAVAVSTLAALAAYIVTIPADVTSMARAGLQLLVFVALVVPGTRLLTRTSTPPADPPTDRTPAAMRSLM